MPGGYVDPNWPPPNPLEPGYAPVIIYGYVPSKALAISATVLFGLSFILHIIQLFHYRTWYIVTIPIALLLELLGYSFRTLSSQSPYYVLWFILQYFFIVTAPVFLSAGIYAILSVLIKRTGNPDRYSPLLPPKWILAIFITSDVVCTIVQICGAALIGVAESNKKDPSTGNHILLAGLSAQAFVFFIFLCLVFLFLRKARKVVLEIGSGIVGFLVAFVVATLLVYLRTCFRLSETAGGVYSHLFTTEGFFAGLEFVPILLAVWLFNIWHPGRCLRKDVAVGREEY